MLWPGVSRSFLPSEGEPAHLSCHRKENSSEGEWQITWWVKKRQRFCQAWASVREDESRAVGRPFRQSCEARSELIGIHPEWWQRQRQWLFSIYWTITVLHPSQWPAKARWRENSYSNCSDFSDEGAEAQRGEFAQGHTVNTETEIWTSAVWFWTRPLNPLTRAEVFTRYWKYLIKLYHWYHSTSAWVVLLV